MKRPERIYRPFQVRVHGTTCGGRNFKLDTVLENVSAGGLYVRLPHCVPTGARLAFVIRFCTNASGHEAPRLVVRGRVLRAEPQPGGDCGFAVAFTRHRFI